MATWDDVRGFALSLPEVVEIEGDNIKWSAGDKRMFAWQRPLRKGDLLALGDSAPTGSILGVRVADLDAKEQVLAEQPDWCFTTPHFNGYPAVLVQLDLVPLNELAGLIEDAWAARAPKRVVKTWAARPSRGISGT